MAQCVEFSGNSLQRSLDTVEECTGFILVSPTEYNAFFQASGLTQADVAAAFAFGFGAVVLSWAAQYPIKVAKQLISQL